MISPRKTSDRKTEGLKLLFIEQVEKSTTFTYIQTVNATGYVEPGRHHVTPISKRSGNDKISPETELLPVCPNCYMILYKKADGKYLSVEDLKKRIQKSGGI